MLFPFFAGILLMRVGKRIHVKGAFTLCSLLLIVLFAIPRIGGPTHLWMNGLYEAFCIIVLFPLIVSMGAGGSITGKYSTRLCHFFGEISYPLYITHYPLIYVYTAWVVRDKVPAAHGAIVGALLLATSITIAYACLKLYDEPARAWLQRRFILKRT
jgi:peptidoglycan/LPS O-acetylase OafA/YrhL